MTRRLSTVDDLADWMTAARERGASRFELWQKVRGGEQRRLLVPNVEGDVWDAADEILSRVARDRRLETGNVSFAVFAYEGEKTTPSERVFVVASESAVAMPLAPAEPSGMPIHAISTVFASVQQMTQGAFGALQRENEQQRRTNESLVRASTAHFDTFAKGYERTFADMQSRLESALMQQADFRAKADSLLEENKRLHETIEKLENVNHLEKVEAEKDQTKQKLLADSLNLLLPTALAHFTGASDAGLSALVRSLADSLTPQQTQAIFSVLNEQQRAALGTLFARARSAKPSASPTEAKPQSASSPSATPSPTTTMVNDFVGKIVQGIGSVASPPPSPSSNPSSWPKSSPPASSGTPSAGETNPMHALFAQLAPEQIFGFVDQYVAWSEQLKATESEKNASSTPNERPSM